MPVGPWPDFESCVKAQMDKGYDEETARKICGKIEQQTREARFVYKVKAEPFTLQGGRYAKAQVIDTTTGRPSDPHGIRWGVTKQALTKALRSLLQAPLLGPPELGHEGRPVGKPVQVKANGSAEAIYEITDPETWKKITSGEWKAVSPQVLAKAEEQENGTVQVTDFVFEHVALVPEGAFPSSQVQETFEGPLENFGFAYSLSAALFHDHSSGSGGMAQDDEAMGTRIKSPSQPQVPETKRAERGDVMSHLTAAEFSPTAEWPDSCFAYVPPSAKGPEGRKSDRGLPYRWPDGRIDVNHLRNALARWNQVDFHSQEAKMETLRELCRAAKQVGIESTLCEEKLDGACKGESYMSEEKDKRIAELEATVKELQGKLAASEQKVEILERKKPYETFQAELERLKAENKELKEWKAKIQDEEQTALAADVADLRIRAEIIDERDRSKAIEELKKYSTDALETMKSDLEVVVAQMTFEPRPKAKFRARKIDNMVESVRAELFGYTRDEKGELN
ncbi:MAG: hypothetical protein QXO25_03625 [Candidatus Bathyarchaeia archaeon]